MQFIHLYSFFKQIYVSSYHSGQQSLLSLLVSLPVWFVASPVAARSVSVFVTQPVVAGSEDRFLSKLNFGENARVANHLSPFFIPSIPFDLRAVLNDTQTRYDTAVFELTWQKSTATGFVLETIVGNSSPRIDTLPPTTRVAFKAPRGEADSSISFRLRAFDQSGSSDYSEAIQRTIPSTFLALRIDCGNTQPVQIGDKTFSADRYVANETDEPSFLRTFTAAVDTTASSVLYQNIRTGNRFVYYIPVPNGRYQVDLSFAEMEFTQASRRVFSVDIEGNVPELVDFDVFSAAGGARKALTRTFINNVGDGNMSIQFTGQVGEAMIAAIQITPDDAAEEGKLTLKIYPNPSRGDVYAIILANGPFPTTGEPATMEIYTLQGQLVEQQTDTQQTGQFIANQRGILSAGVYVVRVRTAGKNLHQKLIVTH